MSDAEQTGRQSTAATESPFELAELRGWVGFKIDDVDGSASGRVEGAFVDAEDGLPRWLAIRVGRFGRRSALPIGLVAGGVKRVWIPYARELIRSAPAVDLAAGLTREKELELCDHFWLGESHPRRAQLADREPESRTAVWLD